MSVSGVSSPSFYVSDNHNFISKRQAIEKEFQQLGQDLKSGDLSAAQTDFTTLQQMVPKLNSTTPQSADPRVKAFAQLGQDLQSGNLAAAQQDYVKIQHMVGHHERSIPQPQPVPTEGGEPAHRIQEFA